MEYKCGTYKWSLWKTRFTRLFGIETYRRLSLDQYWSWWLPRDSTRRLAGLLFRRNIKVMNRDVNLDMEISGAVMGECREKSFLLLRNFMDLSQPLSAGGTLWVPSSWRTKRHQWHNNSVSLQYIFFIHLFIYWHYFILTPGVNHGWELCGRKWVSLGSSTDTYKGRTYCRRCRRRSCLAQGCGKEYM